jgi:flavorubredoxin
MRPWKNTLDSQKTTSRLAEGDTSLASKVLVLYYTRTGSTGKMAEAVAEGAKSVGGTEVDLLEDVSAEALAGYDAIIFGMPTYHHSMTNQMKSLLEDIAVKNVDLKVKVAAAFGSYGWSGEAPKMIIEVLKNKFGMNVEDQPLMIRYEPDELGLQKCREFGRRIAEKVAH